jgi:hypothetical protein
MLHCCLRWGADGELDRPLLGPRARRRAFLATEVGSSRAIGFDLSHIRRRCALPKLTGRQLTKPRPHVKINSMAKTIKLPENVLKFFQATGSEGGKARAERHSKEELREWGKKGGRPKGSGKKQQQKGKK